MWSHLLRIPSIHCYKTNSTIEITTQIEKKRCIKGKCIRFACWDKQLFVHMSQYQQVFDVWNWILDKRAGLSIICLELVRSVEIKWMIYHLAFKSCLVRALKLAKTSCNLHQYSHQSNRCLPLYLTFLHLIYSLVIKSRASQDLVILLRHNSFERKIFYH